MLRLRQPKLHYGDLLIKQKVVQQTVQHGDMSKPYTGCGFGVGF